MKKYLFTLLLIAGLLACEERNLKSRYDIQPSKFYIPGSYRGLIVIEYGIIGAPSIELNEGYFVYIIPESGLLKTSSDFNEIKSGWAPPSKYYNYYVESRSGAGARDYKAIQEESIFNVTNGKAPCKRRKISHTQFLAFRVRGKNYDTNICEFLLKHNPESFTEEEPL